MADINELLGNNLGSSKSASEMSDEELLKYLDSIKNPNAVTPPDNGFQKLFMQQEDVARQASLDTPPQFDKEKVISDIKKQGDTFEPARAIQQLGGLPVKPMGMADSLAARSSLGEVKPPVEEQMSQDQESDEDMGDDESNVQPLTKQEQPLQIPGAPPSQASVLDFLSKYQEATKNRNDNNLTANMLKAGSIIGASIAGSKDRPGVEVADALIKQNENAPEDVRNLAALQGKQLEMNEYSALHDASSPKSKAMQKLLTSYIGPEKVKAIFGQDIGSLSAYDAEKILKTVGDNETRKILAEGKAGEKQAKMQEGLDKQFVQASEKLDPTKGRAGIFGDYQKNVYAADRANQLIAKASGGFDLIPSEMEELAIATNRLLAGAGGNSRAQIEALVPHTLRGKVQGWVQWLKNEPTGTKQQEFVKRMMGTINREKDLAIQNIKETQIKRAKGVKHLEEKDPERFYQMLEDQGISKEEYQQGIKPKSEKGEAVKKSSNKVSKDQLKAYAAKHGIDENKAKQFLSSKGYQVE